MEKISFKTIKYNIAEVADYERAKKGKVYPPCVCIKLSASDGQVYYNEGGEISSQYAVFVPKNEEKYPSIYLHAVLSNEFERFYCKHNTDINLQIDALEYLTVRFHRDAKAVEFVTKMMATMDRMIELYDKYIGVLKEIKRYLLAMMFPR